ncbi:MAG TPA: hypothetical protein VFK90_01920 [Anaeromyxobacter sp.]|nr:hypothetical protein [Anaeromyxobacter sp.]
MGFTSISGVRLFALALGPFLLLIAVCMPLATDAKPGVNPEFIGFAAVEAALVLAALALLAPGRFPWAACGSGALAAVLFAVVSPSAGGFADWLRATPAFVLIPAAWLLVERLEGRGRARPALRERAPASGGAAGGGECAGRLGPTFASKLTWLLAAHPLVGHDGEISPEGFGSVWLPKANEEGFEVRVLVTPDEIQVYAGSLAHLHFVAGTDPSFAASSALACVHDLLSTEARLRERISGGPVPYSARIERRTPAGWRVATRTVTLAGPLGWLLGRPERIRQNRQLPPRSA